jgi:hypothetical protein
MKFTFVVLLAFTLATVVLANPDPEVDLKNGPSVLQEDRIQRRDDEVERLRIAAKYAKDQTDGTLR